MQVLEQLSFALKTFQGPMDYLLLLLRREELDIREISLSQLLEQYGKKREAQEPSPLPLEVNAEFIAAAAHLLWFKSLSLLEKRPEAVDLALEDTQFTLIHSLVEYQRLRQAACHLSSWEESSSSHHYRGRHYVREGRALPLGIDHITLEELGKIWQNVHSRLKAREGECFDEPWKVADKVEMFLSALSSSSLLKLSLFFLPSMTREELVTAFLALLELIREEKVAFSLDGDDLSIQSPIHA